MDPIANKIATTLPNRSGSNGTVPPAQPAKISESKFDQVRKKLKANQAAPGAPASSDTAIGQSQRISQPDSAQSVQKSLTLSRYHLQKLNEKISTAGNADAIPGLKGRLESIEQQYTKVDSAMKSLPANASPQQWLALQQQVYGMNENISALSKIVGQASSGVKSILQMQV